MNQLSKNQRTRLILVAVITGVALAGIWFGLVRRQYDDLDHLRAKKGKADRQMQQVREVVKNSAQLEQQLVDARKALALAEADTASGDLYSWVITTVRNFKAGYKVEIPQFGPISVGEMNLLPRFPYKQATLSISGTAYFHEFGRFLADFENRFPHIRVVNLTLDLNSSPTKGQEEELSFQMDIVTLVTPKAS